MDAYTGFARAYDALMHDVQYDAWAQYLHGLIQEALPQNAGEAAATRPTLLDCACGTGAFALRFAKMGYAVTASDRSEDMLREAQRHARAARLTIPFVRQDLRALRLHRQVDVVNCACDGVNYLLRLADVAAFFRAAYAACKQGGVLLFDMSTEHKLRDIVGNHTFGDAQEDCAYVWNNRYEPEARLSTMALSCFIKLKDSAHYERCEEMHTQRAHRVEELTPLLAQAGFTQVRTYEAFTRNTPGEQAERIQFVAAKE